MSRRGVVSWGQNEAGGCKGGASLRGETGWGGLTPRKADGRRGAGVAVVRE